MPVPSSDAELEGLAQRRVGTVLRDKYRIDRVLGVGGMAAVYAATHRNSKQFAIKVLHPELSLRAALRARFVKEGYVANMVKHPGAVAVLDDDVAEDGAAFLVMELLEGATLKTLWRAGGQKLPLREVLVLGHRLLDVLDAAHKRGIVHRDVKPANLFLTTDGQLKVLDFGIARLADGTDSVSTVSGVMLGTPTFMAPEQALGQSSDIDARTDVWAVGATLFTLLSGQFVHDADTTQKILVLAATVPARSLAVAEPTVPKPVILAVDRALSFERDGRFPSADAMREALAQAYRSEFGEPIADSKLTALAATAVGAATPQEATISETMPAQGPGFTPTVQAARRGGTISQVVTSSASPAARSILRRAVLPWVAVAACLGVVALGVWARRSAPSRALPPTPATSAEPHASEAPPVTARESTSAPASAPSLATASAPPPPPVASSPRRPAHAPTGKSAPPAVSTPASPSASLVGPEKPDAAPSPLVDPGSVR